MCAHVGITLQLPVCNRNPLSEPVFLEEHASSLGLSLCEHTLAIQPNTISELL